MRNVLTINKQNKMDQIDTPTPRTDEMRSEYVNFQNGKYTVDVGDVFVFAKRLERELTAVTEQRDRLAEALRKFVGDALFCSHADTATTVLPHQQVDDSGDALTIP